MSLMTPAKFAAHRSNALRSTGPKTPQGKEASAANATRHGLLSTRIAARGEKEAEYVAFRDRMRDELDPAGELESVLVDRIVAAAWRLRRMLRVEGEMFTYHGHNPPERPPNVVFALAFLRDANNANAFTKISRYETTIERSLYRALHELQRLQAARRGAHVPLPVAVDVALDVDWPDPGSAGEPGAQRSGFVPPATG